jgi:flagellar biosynthesis protein FlhA
MAIDADLNAGLIKEDEARRRRERIAREADFYGAMDGATKFVRGDAIAGIIITLINILGGLIIGTVRFGMSIGQALETFTILTVGDGLVSQVPALLVSLAAGLMVTRATAESNLGQEFIGQLTGNWKALAIAGGFVALVGLTPLPLFQSLVVGGILLATGYIIRQGLKKQEQRAQEEKRREAARTRAPERVDALLHVDPMDLEVGHGLLRLVDPQQGGPMLERITRIRRQMAVELGIQVPPIRIRDNIQLEPNEYVVRIRGTRVAKGELMPDMYLAMEGAPGAPPITGIPTKEPVFGLPAYWIAESEKDRAEAAGYTVVEPSAVMATHLTEIIKRNAADLLTREEVHALIKNLRQTHPSLVEEVVDKVVKVGEIQKVLQNLLREGVSIRDLATIVETLGDYGARVKDPEILTEYVRNALGRAITQRHLDAEGKIVAITLDPKLEDLLRQHIERTDTGSYLTMSPAMVQKVTARIAKEIEKATQKGQTPVILCSPQVRVHVRRLLEPVDPTVAVLSYNEITRDARVEAVGLVAIEG